MPIVFRKISPANESPSSPEGYPVSRMSSLPVENALDDVVSQVDAELQQAADRVLLFGAQGLVEHQGNTQNCQTFAHITGVAMYCKDDSLKESLVRNVESFRSQAVEKTGFDQANMSFRAVAEVLESYDVIKLVANVNLTDIPRIVRLLCAEQNRYLIVAQSGHAYTIVPAKFTDGTIQFRITDSLGSIEPGLKKASKSLTPAEFVSFLKKDVQNTQMAIYSVLV